MKPVKRTYERVTFSDSISSYKRPCCSPPIIIFGIQLMRRNVLAFNPLSPNSEQHQFFPNNIHTMLRGKVNMRINKMIA